MNSDDILSQCCMRPAGPIVEAISECQSNSKQSRSALWSASACIALAIALHLDSSHGFIQTFTYLYPFVRYVAMGATVSLLGFAFISIVVYVRLVWNCSVLIITPRERQLFGVPNEAPCFRVLASPYQTAGGACIDTPGPKYSPSSFSTPGQASYMGSPGVLAMTPYSPSQSPFPYTLSFCSPCPPSPFSSAPSPGPGYSPSPLGGRVRYGDPSPTSRYGSHSPGVSGGKSYPSSDHPNWGAQNTTSFSNSFSSSMMRGDVTPPPPYSHSEAFDNLIGLHSRHCSVSPRASPLRSDELIRTPGELQEYIRGASEIDTRSQQATSSEMARNAGARGNLSFWSYNHNKGVTPSLRRYHYQSASRSPQSPATVSSSKDGGTCDDTSTSPFAPDMPLWAGLDVCLEDLDHWVEKLRKWISQTILARVVDQINEVNRSLAGVGSDDVQIGEVSLATLKQVAQTKGHLIPKLEPLIPFLDITNNQEYLVQRLRDLSRSGCMSAFKWNTGGEFKGKPWEENLPTDSAILMHVLCSYMDSRIPAHPKYPDGKTFTNQHFIRVPDKPHLTEKKDSLCIYQARINPPHFKVIIDENIRNLKPGRNNLFHSILMFFHHVNTKEHGMLRRVNLGLSGINILWVFDK